MSGKSVYDCESGGFDVYDFMGPMIQRSDCISVVLKHPKDKMINYTFRNREETEKFISSLLNREQTNLRLYIFKPKDKETKSVIEDNVDELRENIQTNMEVQYVDNLSVQFIASDKSVMIENGFLGEEGLVEAQKNNVCDNPYGNSRELMESLL